MKKPLSSLGSAVNFLLLSHHRHGYVCGLQSVSNSYSAVGENNLPRFPLCNSGQIKISFLCLDF